LYNANQKSCYFYEKKHEDIGALNFKLEKLRISTCIDDTSIAVVNPSQKTFLAKSLPSYTTHAIYLLFICYPSDWFNNYLFLFISTHTIFAHLTI
jgi:hypothetical protein